MSGTEVILWEDLHKMQFWCPGCRCLRQAGRVRMVPQDDLKHLFVGECGQCGGTVMMVTVVVKPWTVEDERMSDDIPF